MRRGAVFLPGMAMIEILRTNDAVALSLAEALLSDAGIECFVADRHMSALEGSIGAFQRRLLVDRDLESRARRTLVEGGLGAYLRQGPA
jgi:Putative prokaryotic signal transducing protein